MLRLAVVNVILSLFASQVWGTASSSDVTLYHKRAPLAGQILNAMQSSIRTSWEQGTAAGGVLETNDSEYSVFGSNPFKNNGAFPVSTLRLALSAAVRQTSDGRLSQQINDAEDMAALDGASAGSSVLLGTYTDSSRTSYWQKAAAAQLNYVLNKAPRTSTGAISSRADTKQYWADGVYMGFPFIAAYGAVTNNQTLLQIAYDQCRLYRNALIKSGPHGNVWAHIYSDDTKSFVDSGLWSTGNGWASLGMLRVQVAIMKSSHASAMQTQINNLTTWIKEILDGTMKSLLSSNLLPDYISGGANFGDAASTAAIASVAYRMATLHPQTFGSNYTTTAAKMRDAVLGGVNNLGVMSPIVDPLNWGDVGVLSTESQAFGLMMMAAWRDFLGISP